MSPFSYYSLLPNFPSTRLLRFGTSLVQLCRKSSNQSGKVGDYGAAVTRLRFPVSPRPIRMRRAEGVGGGVTGRMMLLRRYVSKLLDDERIELPWPHATETRLYAERLIQESILASAEQDLVSLFELWKNSKEPKTNDKLNLGILELSVFWLTEERLVEKLFKVFEKLIFNFVCSAFFVILSACINLLVTVGFGFVFCIRCCSSPVLCSIGSLIIFTLK